MALYRGLTADRYTEKSHSERLNFFQWNYAHHYPTRHRRRSLKTGVGVWYCDLVLYYKPKIQHTYHLGKQSVDSSCAFGSSSCNSQRIWQTAVGTGYPGGLSVPHVINSIIYLRPFITESWFVIRNSIRPRGLLAIGHYDLGFEPQSRYVKACVLYFCMFASLCGQRVCDGSIHCLWSPTICLQKLLTYLLNGADSFLSR